ncbi:UNVERIFIED_CONTAM: Polyadenylate-binding protein-interacting protein 11 [Sesamum indicum]
MAVVENAAINSVTSSNPDAQQNNVAGDHPHHQQSTKAAGNNQKSTKPTDQNFHLTQQKISNGHHQLQQHPINGNGVPLEKKMDGDDDGGEGFKREMRDLEEMLSKLNPMAEEFVPPSLAALGGGGQHRLLVASPHAAAVAAASAGHFGYNANGFVMQQHLNTGVSTGNSFRRKKNGFTNGKRRMNSRTSMAQREDVIRRTVYVSDIDHQSEDEREMCARTIYCTNIDKKVTQADVKLFFESICGEVHRLRLLGDYHHSTRIAFVEFVMAESAIAALNCSGAVLGSLPIRVSPSKTPVRPRAPRQSMN